MYRLQRYTSVLPSHRSSVQSPVTTISVLEATLIPVEVREQTAVLSHLSKNQNDDCNEIVPSKRFVTIKNEDHFDYW